MVKEGKRLFLLILGSLFLFLKLAQTVIALERNRPRLALINKLNALLIINNLLRLILEEYYWSYKAFQLRDSKTTNPLRIFETRLVQTSYI